MELVKVRVRDINSFVRKATVREGLRLLDFKTVFAPDGGARKPAYAAEDRSHMTAAGYQALTKYADSEFADDE